MCESMANGRYDIAQELLEGALDQDPGNEEVCDALLDLYEQGGLFERFFETYTASLGRQLGHAERWARLAATHPAWSPGGG